MASTRLPLEDYMVLDLTQARAGPTSARVLADWGANVIQIVPPPSSGRKGVTTGSIAGFDYQNLHRNKRSIAIDLTQPDGHALFMRLAEKADVIVENFRGRRKTSPQNRFRRHCRDQSAYRLWQHLRLRTNRPLS